MTSRTRGLQGFGFTACLLGMILLVSGLEWLPAGARPPGTEAGLESVADVWPQHWDLFAAEPEAPVTTATMVAADGGLTPVGQLQASTVSAGGLGRGAAARFVELGDLRNQVDGAAWSDCAALSPADCVAAALRRPPVARANPTAHPAVCGHVLLAVLSPRRWTADTADWTHQWKILRAVNTLVSCGGGR
ncbi:MAG: hypothetical protein HOW97_24075 [Catenulispora sp.]|nr:hypothetical protein [Catenulispora sp.]